MTILSPKLIINKLVLVGREKDYIVNFHSGINIIHGDSDTGKSSILNLVDYLLGSSRVDMYNEIEQHGKYGLLEVSLNEIVYTIKRDIFNTNEFIDVYHSNVEKMNEVFPMIYSPNFNKEGPDGYYSDFLLSALNIPIVKVKQSPTKENSKMVRLSFRDIIKYNYFNQDEIGSKELLDRKNYSLVAKNKETFKFIHNVLDTQITEVQKQIGEKNNEKLKLKNKEKVISSFLLETRLSTKETLKEEKIEVKSKVTLVEDEVQKISKLMKSDNEEIEQLREIVLNLETEIDALYKEKKYKEQQFEQNLRLRKEYEVDIEKLEISLLVRKRRDSHTTSKVKCPLCQNNMVIENTEEPFTENSDDIIKRELNNLKNRFKDLKLFIKQLKNEINAVEHKIYYIDKDLERARQALDKSANNFISPYISQRDLLISEKSSLIEKSKNIEYFIKVRNQLLQLTSTIESLNGQITELNKKLERLESSSPSVDKVIKSLGIYLVEFLEFIDIRNPFGIKISEKTFLPIVRDRDYVNLTSGGLRTLVSIGYLISILNNSLHTETNYPSIIMMDTVGKYLGKTQNSDTEDRIIEDDEGISDPSKYLNIYKFLNTFSTKLLQAHKDHQIIIVDNDFPRKLEKDFDKYVIKRFSTVPRVGYEAGFIDNA